MTRFALYLFCLIFLPVFSFSQTKVRVIKPVKTYPTKTNLSVGVGVTNSFVFLARNTTEQNDALGITTSLVYGGAKSVRFSLEYTRYGKIDIAPTWYDVRANSLEANVHVIYKSKGNMYFYPLFGISYNVFSGYFTGKDDYLNLNYIYPKNENITSRWVGLNTGVGIEYVIKPIIIFTNFKMRVGIAEGYHNSVNIMDVCYSLGLRYNLVVPSVYRLFKGTKNRYFIDKRDSF